MDSAPPPSSPPFVRAAAPHRGVRRRRDEAIEIEALDAHTMQQRSYNYFQRGQHHHATFTPTHAPTFQSSLRRSVSSRKRQRTLAEQLEGLTLSRDRGGGASNHQRSSRFVELDEHGRERPASMASDEDSEAEEDDEEEHDVFESDYGEMQVYGGVPNTMRKFFESGRRDHRPLDRIYRHYVSAAAKHRRDATDVSASSGKELVVFQPPPSSLRSSSGEYSPMNLPTYLSITPQEFQQLSTEEKRQWYHLHVQYSARQAQDQSETRTDSDEEKAKPEGRTGSLAGTFPSFSFSRQRSSSGSSTGSFRAIGVPTTDDDLQFDSGDDVEMMEDDGVDEPSRGSRMPHLADDITHAEWFSDEEL